MQIEPEFAEQYTLRERIRFIILALVAGGSVVVGSETCLFPWLREFAAAAPCRKVWGIEGLTVLWYGLFVGMPLLFATVTLVPFSWGAYKILRDDQYPPLKQKVLKPTIIRRGFKARVIAYLHLSAFLPFLVISIWGYFQAAEMSITLQTKAGECPVKLVSWPSDRHL